MRRPVFTSLILAIRPNQSTLCVTCKSTDGVYLLNAGTDNQFKFRICSNCRDILQKSIDKKYGNFKERR